MNSDRLLVWKLTRLRKLSNQEILIGHFFDQVLIPVGWYTHLPQLYQRSPDTGPLRLTIRAASFFLAANQSHDDQIRREARVAYGMGLNALNASISNSQQQLQDETLCAILILNVLDDINGLQSFRAGTHLHGCAQLLELRKQKGITTYYTSDLTHSVVIQTQALVARTEHGEDELFASWLCRQSPEPPATIVYDFCYRAGKFARTATKFCSWASEMQRYDKLESIIRAGHELDASTTRWFQCGGERWKHRKQSLNPATHDQHPDYYADMQVAKVWNHYRCSRVLIHEAILSAIEGMDNLTTVESTDELSSTKTRSHATIKTMLTDVCNSIPFHLQKVDSHGLPCSPRSSRLLGACALLWPLEIVRQCRWADIEHRRDITKASYEIDQVIGVRGVCQSTEVRDEPIAEV